MFTKEIKERKKDKRKERTNVLTKERTKERKNRGVATKLKETEHWDAGPLEKNRGNGHAARSRQSREKQICCTTPTHSGATGTLAAQNRIGETDKLKEKEEEKRAR